MKRPLHIFIFCVIFWQSCGFLGEDPHSGQPEEAVITSATTLQRQAVLSLYDHIGGNVDGEGLQGTYCGVYDLQTFASNEAIIPVRGGDWLDGGLWIDLYSHTWTADNECCENAWLYLYQLVGLCNHSLAMLDRYKNLLSNEQFTVSEAEVRAVRALAYTYLLDLFARVPIVTREDISLNEIKQSERSEVFDFVWSELQHAYANLPDERSNSRGEYYGRITRPVVSFLLMKMALNIEVWRDDDWTDILRPDGKQVMLACDVAGQRNAWEAVEHYGQAILNSTAGYVLCASQTHCFATYNEDAAENIFTIPMDPNIYRNRFKNLFRSLHYQHAAALGYGGENGSCATQETMDVFGYGTSKRDCRFATTFFAGVVHVGGMPLVLSSGDTLVYYPREVQPVLTGSPYVATAGARMSKYAFDPGGIFDGQLRNSDIVLYRLADVYLMMAEAKVRNGQDGQAEYDLVHQREALAMMSNCEPRQATLENIYYERWIELMWEGWHRQDQIRFSRYAESVEENFLTVFPIPQTALQTNTLLRQNKGYE
ncbi:MAG: RagB/SusD family nutrient uptake outer membrane protein [Paludibacteraceae bacterium]|nr:RagB/SusD family nutrient uptake outer membrane protein [Paludibacteraceae bacterium]